MGIEIPGWASNASNSVSRLSKLTGHTIGPNSLLKVMAGDTINAKMDYYYPAPVTNNHNSLITDIVAGLVQAITGSSATTPLVHGSTTNITSDLTANAPFASMADPNQAATDSIPRAYLNVVFFDERFNFVSEGSTAVRVSQPGDNAAPLVLPPNTKAPKNGYAYIYLSNENDDAVYFDNFTVSDNRGRIIEENHYYAFGLKIAGISSVKFDAGMEGSLKNNNLYNDKELWDDADLNWYDYGFRNYDAQIGRFTQLDPLTDDYPELTNYQYASNDPILNIDLDGLEGIPTPGGIWNGSFLEQGVRFGSQAFTKLAPSLIGTALREGSLIADHKFADAAVKKALEGGVEKGGNTLLKSVGLTIYLTLKPVETGKELTPREMYEKFWYKFKPKEPEENDDREHEQYVLRANRTGYYPIMKWGYKDPVGTVKLKRGDVWKYGTTVNPDSRYSQIWLRKMNLRKFPEETGSAPYVLAQEGIKIIKYFIEYGKLPPGNKMFK